MSQVLAMKNLSLGLLLSCYIFINCTDSTAEVVLIESRFSLDSLNFPIETN